LRCREATAHSQHQSVTLALAAPIRSFTLLAPLEASGALHARSVLLLAAALLNLACFALAATLLQRLGQVVLQHDGAARVAALLFCITPAGIFMTAVYTERRGPPP